MGRASNRKKAQRQAGKKPQADAATQEALLKLVAGLQRLVAENEARSESEAAALLVWYGGADPVPAEAPQWAKDSLGDRFCGGFHLSRARTAPSLASAEIPDAAMITADPGHWNVATRALIRAVAFDGLGLDHPAVRRLLEILTPVAETELAYNEIAYAAMHRQVWDWDADEDFPELDGPVFLLGACALVDAVWAAVGEDPLSDVLGLLMSALETAVPGLDAQAAADALIGAFATEYRCEQPGDDEILDRIKNRSGNALENLVAAGALPAADVLPAGLAILSALAHLCQSDSASVLQRTA